MDPLIGIPLCLDDRERWKPGRRYLYLDALYAAAVERAGGTPVMLPLQRDPEALAARIDGLLLPGGDDFVPEPPDPRYPESVSFDPVAREQLAFDRALLASCRSRGLPVLGICYGAQLLAIHQSGRLHHHLPIDVPEARSHRLDETDGRHPVRIEPRSRLAAAIGAETTLVNSLHHQAIAEPGPGLRVCARAEDGVIEAVEAVDGSFALGVQWHPERLAGPAGEGLFDALVAACRRG